MRRPNSGKGIVFPIALHGLGVIGFVTVGAIGMLPWGGAAACLSGYFALVAMTALFHARLIRGAAEEERTAAGESRGGELFADETDVVNTAARRALKQFERWLIPVLSLLLGVFSITCGFLIWRQSHTFTDYTLAVARVPLPVSVSLLVLAFLFFLVSRYASELADASPVLLLRPVASGAMLACVAAFFGGVAGTLVHLLRNSEVHADHLAALSMVRFHAGVLIALGFEQFSRVLIRMYRPGATRFSQTVVLYDSELCSLLVSPAMLLTSFSDLLEYQFGFRASRERLSAFLFTRIAPLLGLGVGVLVLASCLVIVTPAEISLIERWGMPRGEELSPGPHLKLPWPIEKTRRFSPARIKSFRVGLEDVVLRTQDSGTGTWSAIPASAPLFLSGGRRASAEAAARASAIDNAVGIALPVTNLLVAEMVVSYQVKRIGEFHYTHAEPEGLLRTEARRVLLGYLAGHDGMTLMHQGRESAAAELTRRLQIRCDNLQMGIMILSAGLARLQPPDTVAPAFQAVSVEEQDRRRHLLEAGTYSVRTIPAADASADDVVKRSRREAVAVTTEAEAFAGLFQMRRRNRDDLPEMYSWLLYLERLEKTFAGVPKVVLASECKDQVLSLDLKRDQGPGLLDFPVPDSNGE